VILTVDCVTNLMCADHISICTQYNFGYAFTLPVGVVMSFGYLIRQTELTCGSVDNTATLYSLWTVS